MKGCTQSPMTGVSEGKTIFYSIDGEDDISELENEDERDKQQNSLPLSNRENGSDNKENKLATPSIMVDTLQHKMEGGKSTRKFSVYDRLSERGRQYAQNRVNLVPPKLQV